MFHLHRHVLCQTPVAKARRKHGHRYIRFLHNAEKVYTNLQNRDYCHKVFEFSKAHDKDCLAHHLFYLHQYKMWRQWFLLREL